MTSHLIPDDAVTAGRSMLKDALKRPLHDLRISLLDRCNFRCPYCMPESKFHAEYEFLTRANRLTHKEILHVARVATELGVSKLRLTGGEPLLDKNLASTWLRQFIRRRVPKALRQKAWEDWGRWA